MKYTLLVALLAVAITAQAQPDSGCLVCPGLRSQMCNVNGAWVERPLNGRMTTVFAEGKVTDVRLDTPSYWCIAVKIGDGLTLLPLIPGRPSSDKYDDPDHWLEALAYYDYILFKRLDSLTHAFQALHDSLVRLERDRMPYFIPGIQIDPGLWQSPKGTPGIYLPKGTLSDSAIRWWREHGQPLSTGIAGPADTTLCNCLVFPQPLHWEDKNGLRHQDTDSVASEPLAPKKKRRKG